MTLSVTNIGDNAPNPGISAYAYIPDQLIADAKLLVTQPLTLASGTLTRGAVLGQKATSSVIPTTGSNTGNGTIGSLSLTTGKFGNYVLTATSATTWTVKDPEGASLTNATTGSAYNNGGIQFTITAGGTAFVAGDSFTLEAVDDVGEFILSVRTASDGSQNPKAILVMDSDASAGPIRAGGYFMGEFNLRAVNYDSSWTLQQLMAALPAGLILKSSVSAADPS